MHNHDQIHCEICIHKPSSFIFLTSVCLEIGRQASARMNFWKCAPERMANKISLIGWFVRNNQKTPLRVWELHKSAQCKQQQSQLLIAIYFNYQSRWCCWLGHPMGMGSLQGPGRWRGAVLLWWEWRAGTGAGLGRGKQGNLTPEPHCSPGGTQDFWRSSLRSPACKLQLCLIGLGTGMCRLSQQPLYPLSSSQGCSVWGLLWPWAVMWSWVRLLWGQLRCGKRMCGEGLALFQSLLGYTLGMGAPGHVPCCPSWMGFPAQPWSCLLTMDVFGGYLNLVILTSLTVYGFHCSRFPICCISKRTFSFQGNSKSLEINGVWRLYKWN